MLVSLFKIMFKETDLEVNQVTINVEDTKFLCNRKVLSHHSPYFDAMFNGNFIEKDEKVVNVQLIKVNGLSNILKVISDDRFYIEYDELLDTLQCACMLQFDNIKSYCIDRLTDKLLVDHCLQIWFETEELDVHPLCEKAKCKALVYFNNLRNNDNLMKLNLKQIHSYLSSTLLNCDNELDVFETGMRWWYNFANKLQNSDNRTGIEMKHLITILNCVDFHSVSKTDINVMLTYPDIKSNTTIASILESIRMIMDNKEETFELSEEVMKQAKCLFFKPRKRHKTYLPCVVTSEFQACVGRDLNISYYDAKSKCMEKLFNTQLYFDTRCAASLKGGKILGYKENLLLFGGEYHYGSADWNKNVWLYDTCRNTWEILTKMPKERRHFKSYIIDEKLFIIGGTGKFRIIFSDDMFYYDFRTDEWVTNVKLPHALFDINICEFKKQLFIVPGHLLNYGYLFNTSTKVWQKIEICDPLNLVEQYPDTFLIYSKENTIIIKGANIVEMELKGIHLEVTRCEKHKPLYGDKIGYYKNDNHLFLFRKHDASNNIIYTLDCYNLERNNADAKLLVQINDSIDTVWHIGTGCFSYFHHTLAKDSLCISDFEL